MKRLDRNQALLVVIDVQEKMIPVMSDWPAAEHNLDRLIRGCDVLEMPVLVTEQYVKGLGQTAGAVRRALEETGEYSPIEKNCFSATGCAPFMEHLRKTGRRQILVAGVETHVCVYQTVIDLVSAGFDVNIVADAVASRSTVNRDIAIRRMTSEGAKLTSAEMALFEMLGGAGTQEFRAISKLVK
ncbi:MAG: hydrolase [Thermoanaerobaculia bacterium]